MAPRKKIAVIGGGPMGLACAMRALQRGHHVDVYESGERLGGMSACFELDGLPIERFFHFICGTDHRTFAVLRELGIADSLRWTRTRMGLFHDQRLHEWGNPLALLRFPGLSLRDKLRYGLSVLACKYTRDFSSLDQQTAVAWLRRTLGDRAYQVLWEPLLKLKFYEWSDDISAAWVAARVQRVAQSRESLFHERLGYLEGGTNELLAAFDRWITAHGGAIHTGAAVERVLVDDNGVRGVRVDGTDVDADVVVSTIPLPYVPRMVPSLPQPSLRKLGDIRNIGVATVVLKLRASITPYFWLNISDPTMALPGIIEFTNLHPLGTHVVYLPYYMPQTNERYGWSDAQFRDEAERNLAKINPSFTASWIEALHVFRYHHAQPVCGVGFRDTLPAKSGLVRGFVMADTSYYYPHDRSINDSFILGHELADLADSAAL